VEWRPKQIAGKLYDLSHIHPFKLEVTPKAQGAPFYAVRVTFGFHCFTRGLEQDDPPDVRMRHNGELRCFCFERYGLSKELPGMIQYAAKGRAYFGEKYPNFLIVESMTQQNAPYVAFFNIERAQTLEGYDAAMFVTSAHLRPKLPDRLPAISFATLVDHRVQGKTIRRPEPRKIIVVKRK
jgi:hypothetical protein